MFTQEVKEAKLTTGKRANARGVRCNEHENEESISGVLPFADNTNSLSYFINLPTVMILDDSFPAFKIETSCQSRFDARYWMLGASALGRPRGMVWGGRSEEGSGWGTHVYLWRIHFDIWQNQYNIVNLKNKIK